MQFAEIPAASQVRYDGDPFSYMAAGRTEAWPLVLLHGVGANSMHWRFQFAAFAERFRVIAWNAPGYILSDNFLAETPDWLDYAHAPEGRGHGMTLPPFFPPDDRLAVAC